MLGEDVSPAEMLQNRSPRLDLDSLYGAGPGNPESAKFYEADGLHLQDRYDDPGRGREGQAAATTSRASARAAWPPAQKALIPDPRNDENLIVAQTHLAMINFHNKVVDKIPASLPPAQRFTRARQRVTLHYQWMLRHDYLPRICAARGGQRRVQERSQAGRARRRADRRTDHADRVLGRGVPARATA